MIKFQDRLLKKIDSFALSTLPHSIILTGKNGCGKHTLCKYISEKFTLEMIDISNNTVPELKECLDIAVEQTYPKIYVINAEELGVKSEQKQNTILKFIEEPLKNTFVIILTENISHLLTTVINRCQVFSFAEYSVEQLREFLPKEANYQLLDICRTPGDVINNASIDFLAAQNLAQMVFTKIGIANYQNALSIANKINFKDEPEKFDIKLFVRLLVKYGTENVINSPDPRFYKSLLLTTKLSKDIEFTILNKRHLFEKYLIELKKIWT